MNRPISLILLLVLGGCVVLPISDEKPDEPVSSPAKVESLVNANVGEVMQLMGEPDYRFEHSGRDYLIYEGIGEQSWLLLAHPALLIAFVPPIDFGKEKKVYCALIELDQDDSVRRTATKSGPHRRDHLPCILTFKEDSAIQGHQVDLYAQAVAGDMEAAMRLEKIFQDSGPLNTLIEREELRKAQEGNADEKFRAYLNQVAATPLKWLCQAADLGHPDACHVLAGLYEAGTRGVPRDPVRAYVWYTRAAEHGHPYSHEEADRLAATALSPTQFVKAKNMKKNWQPGQCEAVLMTDTVGSH